MFLQIVFRFQEVFFMFLQIVFRFQEVFFVFKKALKEASKTNIPGLKLSVYVLYVFTS